LGRYLHPLRVSEEVGIDALVMAVIVVILVMLVFVVVVVMLVFVVVFFVVVMFFVSVVVAVVVVGVFVSVVVIMFFVGVFVMIFVAAVVVVGVFVMIFVVTMVVVTVLVGMVFVVMVFVVVVMLFVGMVFVAVVVVIAVAAFDGGDRRGGFEANNASVGRGSNDVDQAFLEATSVGDQGIGIVDLGDLLSGRLEVMWISSDGHDGHDGGLIPDNLGDDIAENVGSDYYRRSRSVGGACVGCAFVAAGAGQQHCNEECRRGKETVEHSKGCLLAENETENHYHFVTIECCPP
jgi:hypothetical protein